MMFVDDGGREKFFAALQSVSRIFSSMEDRRQYFLSFFLPPCAWLHDAMMRDTSNNLCVYRKMRYLGRYVSQETFVFLKIRKMHEMSVSFLVSWLSCRRQRRKEWFAESTAKKCIDYLSESRDHVPWYIYNIYKYSLAYFQMTNMYVWVNTIEWVCAKIREIERKNEKEGWK